MIKQKMLTGLDVEEYEEYLNAVKKFMVFSLPLWGRFPLYQQGERETPYKIKTNYTRESSAFEKQGERLALFH